MTKNERDLRLKEIMLSGKGLALKELFEEKIKELGDIRKWPTDSFEIYGKASVLAITKLEQILNDLLALKEEPTKRTKNPYT